MLSRAQFKEICEALQCVHPEIVLEPVWTESPGDRDLSISLKSLGKTDFFTKDLDEMLIDRKIRIAVHSAKDLPDPLPKGLSIVALTQGVDSRDALVMRPGESWEKLPSGAKIGVSSERRESLLRKLRSDFCFVDLRGTIDARLAKLVVRELDGVVMAEAALIRLGWTHWNRWIFDDETLPLQGKLAVVARIGDEEIKQIFSDV